MLHDNIEQSPQIAASCASLEPKEKHQHESEEKQREQAGQEELKQNQQYQEDGVGEQRGLKRERDY